MLKPVPPESLPYLVACPEDMFKPNLQEFTDEGLLRIETVAKILREKQRTFYALLHDDGDRYSQTAQQIADYLDDKTRVYNTWNFSGDNRRSTPSLDVILEKNPSLHYAYKRQVELVLVGSEDFVRNHCGYAYDWLYDSAHQYTPGPVEKFVQTAWNPRETGESVAVKDFMLRAPAEDTAEIVKYI